ncbi:MAG: rRNA maturation RNase YbeY [Candidatus Portnoybacteria bacterium]|nr:rRNA maturation RNase YbeY [Candidatus Portnoybacteria bacterium]
MIEINNLTKTKIDEEYIRGIAKKTIEEVNLKKEEISIAFVGKEKITELNKKHRNRNHPTDVLAFDYGEIIICIDQAEKQAKENKHSLKKELAILIIHGMLHIAGYEDETEKEYNQMHKKQKEIIKKII